MGRSKDQRCPCAYILFVKRFLQVTDIGGIFYKMINFLHIQSAVNSYCRPSYSTAIFFPFAPLYALSTIRLQLVKSINPLIHTPLSKDTSSAGNPHVPG